MLKKSKWLVLIIIAVFLSGCAFHHRLPAADVSIAPPAVAQKIPMKIAVVVDENYTTDKTENLGGYITAEQLSKALDELKTKKRSKTLDAFLEGKIDERKFGELY